MPLAVASVAGIDASKSGYLLGRWLCGTGRVRLPGPYDSRRRTGKQIINEWQYGFGKLVEPHGGEEGSLDRYLIQADISVEG